MATGAEGFGVGGLDFAAARTSVSVTRPSGPVPFTLARSTPSSAAIRRATGDAFTRASSDFSTFGAGFSPSAPPAFLLSLASLLFSPALSLLLPFSASLLFLLPSPLRLPVFPLSLPSLFPLLPSALPRLHL